VADLTGDGLDDILFEGHSLRPDAPSTDEVIFLFAQEENGQFSKIDGFLPQVNAENAEIQYSGLTAEAANLDDDDDIEIVLASYNDMNSAAIYIFDKNDAGEFILESTEERSGKAAELGATNVEFADIDMDGDQDLIVRLEGDVAVSDITNEVISSGSAHALQIWENKGSLNFENVTDTWLKNSVWDAWEFWNKTIQMADLNNDGYVDLFWNAGPHSMYNTNMTFDVGSWIFLNQNGTHFEQLNGHDEFIIEYLNDGGLNDQSSQYFKLIDVTEEHIEIIGVHENQTLGMITVDIAAINEFIA